MLDSSCEIVRVITGCYLRFRQDFTGIKEYICIAVVAQEKGR